MDLKGETLQAFMTEQQSIKGETERSDLKRLQLEVNAREADCKHELDMKRVEGKSATEVEVHV